MLHLNVNSKAYQLTIDPTTPLLWVLRDDLKLTGTKYGCGIAQCGACIVLINGKATKSCVTPVASAVSKKIITIEGLSKNQSHPVQQAWIHQEVVQCGYCQSGQILSAVALLKSKPNPNDTDIDKAMQGVYCRCGTYPRIRKAIKYAAKLTNKGIPLTK